MIRNKSEVILVLGINDQYQADSQHQANFNGNHLSANKSKRKTNSLIMFGFN